METDRLARKYPIGGVGSGFDAVFRPSAHDASMEWKSIQTMPVESPTPDGGPGVIDLDQMRVTIEID